MKRGKATKAILSGVCAVLLGAILFTSCDGATNPEGTASKTYYVTLYNKGSASDPAAFKDGDTYTLPTPTRTWYTFTAWNTIADGNGTSYKAGDKITVTSKLDLYGQWSFKDTGMTMTGPEFASFCDDRNSMDLTTDVTIKISDPLPSAGDLDNTASNLNITLDLSACTSLKNMGSAYSFNKLVGIVFPAEVESIYALAFANYSKYLVAVTFSDASKTWYAYSSGSWDSSTNKPTSYALKTMTFSATDVSTNATTFKQSGTYCSTTIYEAD